MKKFRNFVAWLWWRRFNWMMRIGWRNVRGVGNIDPRVGWALLGVGYVVHRRRKRQRRLTRAFDVYVDRGMEVHVIRDSAILTRRVTGG